MSFNIHPETAIGLVNLRVTNLDRSIAFYRDVVGLKLLSEGTGSPRSAELTADGVHPLVLLQEIPQGTATPRRSAAGLYHFAILVPDRAALGRSLRRLIDSGIHIGQADHLVSEALYINDPDKNGIEIYADRPRSTWRRDANNHYVMAVDPIDWDGLLEAAGDEPWSELPAGTTIGHIHLHVSDLERSRAFYCGVLGFALEAHMEQSAMFVAAGSYHHHIGLNSWAGVGVPLASRNASGLNYYTIVLPDGPALDEVVSQLRQAEIQVEQDGAVWITHDPSGITIHLCSRS